MAELRADFPAEVDGDAVPPAAVTHDAIVAATPVVVPVAAPVATPVAEASEPPVVITPIPTAPQLIASFAAPPATYRMVSEHDKIAEETHRPVRRHHKTAAGEAPAEPLQLVETASDKVVVQPVFEDEKTRKPVRRRRHAAASGVPAEPLQLVETAPHATTSEGGPSQA